jgi:hypothetical protein
MSDSGSEGPNQRAHERVAVEAFVRVLGGEHEYVFRTRDLSEGGLFLFTRVGYLYPFFVGAALHVDLFDPERAASFKAVVVRIVEAGQPEAEGSAPGFALKIVEIDDSSRAALKDLIDHARRGEPTY